MLEHQKLVLQNISNNMDLFEKELKKSIGWLNSSEIFELYRWAKDNFPDQHQHIITNAFKKYLA